jgi:hypothetical protein
MELVDVLQVGPAFVKGLVLQKSTDRKARGDDSCHDSANSAAAPGESSLIPKPLCGNPVEHRVADSASSAQLDELNVDPIVVGSPTLLHQLYKLMFWLRGTYVLLFSLSLFLLSLFLLSPFHFFSFLFPSWSLPKPLLDSPCQLCPSGRADCGPCCGEKPYL